MAAKQRALPPTRISPETGEILTRDVRPFVVEYKGKRITVDLPGYYPPGDGESVHIGEDMAATDEALWAIKEEVDGIPAPWTIRRIRRKLKLSQRDAGGLFEVGENAFHKYERGLVKPSGPTIQLLWLLDCHPELIDEMRQSPRALATAA